MYFSVWGKQQEAICEYRHETVAMSVCLLVFISMCCIAPTVFKVRQMKDEPLKVAENEIDPSQWRDSIRE